MKTRYFFIHLNYLNLLLPLSKTRPVNYEAKSDYRPCFFFFMFPASLCGHVKSLCVNCGVLCTWVSSKYVCICCGNVLKYCEVLVWWYFLSRVMKELIGVINSSHVLVVYHVSSIWHDVWWSTRTPPVCPSISQKQCPPPVVFSLYVPQAPNFKAARS